MSDCEYPWNMDSHILLLSLVIISAKLHGVYPYPEIGLFLQKSNSQRIHGAEWTTVRQWNGKWTEGTYKSQISLRNDDSEIFIPSTGVYYINAICNISSRNLGRRWLGIKNTATGEMYERTGRSSKVGSMTLALATLLQLNVNQKIAVVMYAENPAEVGKGSSIVVRRVALANQKPEFSATLSRHMILSANSSTQLYKWTTERQGRFQTFSGFSESTGEFETRIPGCYLLNAVLSLEALDAGYHSFKIMVDNRTAQHSKFTTKRHSDLDQVVVSRLLTLRETQRVFITVITTANNAIVSPYSSFSMILLTEGNHKPQKSSTSDICLSVESQTNTVIKAMPYIWNKVNNLTDTSHLKEARMDLDYYNGGLLVKERGYYQFSMHLAIAASVSTSIQMAVIIDGDPGVLGSRKGLYTSVEALSGRPTHLQLSGVFQLKYGQYIAVHLVTSHKCKLSILTGSSSTAVKLFYDIPSYSLLADIARVTTENNAWQAIPLLKMYDPAKLTAQKDSHDRIGDTSTPILHKGIYIISVNLAVKNASIRLIECLVTLTGNMGVVQLLTLGTDFTSNIDTLSGVTIANLDVSDKLVLHYRCYSNLFCTATNRTLLSVAYLAEWNSAPGFSVRIETEQFHHEKEINIDNFTAIDHNPPYFSSKSWNPLKGVYKAVKSGIHYVTCNILLRKSVMRHPRSYFTLKLVITDTQGPREVATARKARGATFGEVLTLSLALPLNISSGSEVSLKLSARLVSSYNIDGNSTFAVVYLPNRKELYNGGEPLFPGFLVGQRTSTSPKVDGRWKTITDWVLSSKPFSNYGNDEHPIFIFDGFTGATKLQRSMAAFISLNAVVKRLAPDPLEATLQLNGQPLEDIFFATDGAHNANFDDVKSVLSFSGVLLLYAGDELKVVLRGTKFYVYSSTHFSLVLLPPVNGRSTLETKFKHQNKDLTPIWSNMMGSPSQGLAFSERMFLLEKSGDIYIAKKGDYLISVALTITAVSQLPTPATVEIRLVKGNIDIEDIASIKLHSDSFSSSICNVWTIDLRESDLLQIRAKSDIATFEVQWSMIFDMKPIEKPSLEIVRRILPPPFTRRSIAPDRKSLYEGYAHYVVEKGGFYITRVFSTVKSHNASQLQIIVSSNGTTIIKFMESSEIRGMIDVIMLLRFEEGTRLDVKVSRRKRNTDTSQNNDIDYSFGLRRISNDPSTMEQTAAVIESDLDSCLSTDPSWVIIKPWKIMSVIQDKTLSDRATEGTFVVNRTGTYLISANIIVESLKADVPLQGRSLGLAVDGIVENGFVLNKTTSSFQTTTFNLAVPLSLQRWQSISLFIRCLENDTLFISQDSSISVTMIDSVVQEYVDDGPRIFLHPSPSYSNSPEGGKWSCEAVGAGPITYSWYRLGEEWRDKISVSDKNVMSFKGLPEETGDYVCAATTGNNIAVSKTGTIDISDIDECNSTVSNITVNCHYDATCVNTIGAFYCKCNDGYLGDGYICEDVNECHFDTFPCHGNATCENTAGSFECSCRPGFEGNGLICTDVDECSVKGLANCDTKSSCINTMGSYHCVCLEGYTGSGFTCRDIDECNLLNVPCDENSYCVNKAGTFECTCRSGWSGNGTHCSDVDECKEGTVNCHGNATCYNSPGSYRCKCDRGFNGDGVISCKALGCMPPPRCSGEFRAGWWPRTPYLTNTSSGSPDGLFKELLNQMVSNCCNNCSLVVFDPPSNGSLQLGNVISQNLTDFACPVYGSREQNYFSGYPYASIVESPGVAFFIKDKPSKSSPLIESLSGSWPILLITFLLAILSGVIMWFLDTMKNPDQFPHSFLEGSWEGFWWAFISMTTVGYGDKAPKSLLGRFFGIIWILIGLVIISTFTATITTMLTASSLANEVRLYGTRVGVLDNSEEYRLAVKRNADVFSYNSVPEILDALAANKIEGTLLDTYVAGEFQEELSKYRLHQIVEHVFTYGVVLTRDGMALKECFKHFLETRQSEVYLTISKAVKPLKEKRKQSYAMDKSSSLFDAKSLLFKYAVFGGLGLLALIFLLGIGWEHFCMKRNKGEKNKYQISYMDEKELEQLGWHCRDQWHRSPLSTEIIDIKSQIQAFSTSWIERLDKLERKHKTELDTAQHYSKNNMPKSPVGIKKSNDKKRNGLIRHANNYDATPV